MPAADGSRVASRRCLQWDMDSMPVFPLGRITGMEAAPGNPAMPRAPAFVPESCDELTISQGEPLV